MNEKDKAVPFVRISAGTIAAVLLWVDTLVARALPHLLVNREMVGQLLLAVVMLVGVSSAAATFLVISLTGDSPSWMKKATE